MIVRPAGIVIKENSILFLEYEYDGHQRFNLPGGNQEEGEDAKTCLIREFKEELGIYIFPEKLLLVAETFAANRTVTHLCFQLQWKSGELAIDKEHTTARSYAWLTKTEIEQASLYPAINKELIHIVKGNLPQHSYIGRIEQPWYS